MLRSKNLAALINQHRSTSSDSNSSATASVTITLAETVDGREQHVLIRRVLDAGVGQVRSSTQIKMGQDRSWRDIKAVSCADATTFAQACW